MHRRKNSDPPELADFWSRFLPEEGQWYCWNLDGARIWLMNRGREWNWATEAVVPQDKTEDFRGPFRDSGPGDRVIMRGIAPRQQVSLRPASLNKPFLLKSRTPLVLHGESALEVDLDLPVSVRFVLESGTVLTPLNTILLSRTWFGDTSSGLLCFLWPVDFLGSGPREESGPEPKLKSLVRCRVNIRNLSKSVLEVRHFAVQTDVLSIWFQEGALVTDRVLIEGLGDGTLRMDVLAEKDPGHRTLLFQAEVGHRELLFKRGVDFLRNITGIS